MIKKEIGIGILVILIMLAYGKYNQETLTDLGLCQVTSVEDLSNLDIAVEEFETEEGGSRLLEEYMEETVEEYVNGGSYAIIGKATGRLQLFANATAQEIVVEKVITIGNLAEVTGKNKNAKENEKVWITGAAGFQIRGEEEPHIAYFNQWINVMQREDRYICFVSGNPYNTLLKEKYYSLNDNLFYGYFNLRDDKMYAANVNYKQAKLSDFGESEVLTTQEQEVESYCKIKNKVLKKMGL